MLFRQKTTASVLWAEPVVEPATVGIPERTVHTTFHEIGSWRVTSFSEGLARVIETDSPRSRTLVVRTFPTPLSTRKSAADEVPLLALFQSPLPKPTWRR